MTVGEIIEECHAIVKDPVKYLLDQKKKHNYKYIGLICVFAPEELFYTAGFIPVRIFGYAQKLREVEKLLPTNCCEFSRNLVETIQTGLADYCDEIFFSHCCDTLQVVGDIFQQQHQQTVTIFNVPTHFRADHSLEYLNAEITSLKKRFETKLGFTISEADLQKSWDIYCENRKLVQEFYQIRSEKPGVISGFDSVAVLMAGMFMPKADHNELLKDVIAGIRDKDVGNKISKRVVVTGFVNGNAELISLIEKCGCVVVDDDLCETFRSLSFYNEQQFQFPVSLSQSILARFCPVKHDAKEDYSDLVIKKYQKGGADAIISILFPFCDPQCMEYAILKRKLNQEGIRSLMLEIVVGKSNFSQLETRIEAFVESLR